LVLLSCRFVRYVPAQSNQYLVSIFIPFGVRESCHCTSLSGIPEKIGSIRVSRPAYAGLTPSEPISKRHRPVYRLMKGLISKEKISEDHFGGGQSVRLSGR
jgi:hypothetical protein